jgi:hypothetical protein
MKVVPVLPDDEIRADKRTLSRNDSRAAHNLSVVLNPFKDHFSIHQQLALNLDGWQTMPDLCLFYEEILPIDWLSEEDEVTIPPNLVIEILFTEAEFAAANRQDA